MPFQRVNFRKFKEYPFFFCEIISDSISLIFPVANVLQFEMQPFFFFSWLTPLSNKVLKAGLCHMSLLLQRPSQKKIYCKIFAWIVLELHRLRQSSVRSRGKFSVEMEGLASLCGTSTARDLQHATPWRLGLPVHDSIDTILAFFFHT